MELPYKKSKEQYVTAKTAGCGIFLLCPDFGLDFGLTGSHNGVKLFMKLHSNFYVFKIIYYVSVISQDIYFYFSFFDRLKIIEYLLN